MNSHIYNLKNKGFALTEVLLAIAVIIIIGIAAYPLYKSAHTSSQVEKFTNDVMLLKTNIDKLYSGQNIYSGIGMFNLAKFGIIPENWISCSDGSSSCTFPDYKTPWGGSIVLQQTMLDGTPNQSGYSLLIYSMPIEPCIKLINNLTPVATVIRNDGALIVKSGTKQITVDNKQAVCASGSVGGAVIFGFQ